jgi:rhamnosyltransferase
MAAPVLSVIIRARDEADNLKRCLELLSAQTASSSEVILVDCGSRDDTVAVARAHGARVLELSPAQFSFGRALNLGAADARAATLVSLSAHAFPPDGRWLSRMAAALQDKSVACASGDTYDPAGARLTHAISQDAELARRQPEWGYANAAGAFRAELWRQHPFREDLPACEDKEWALHWLDRGYRCVIDPRLAVEHDHTHDGLRSIYRRARREAAAYQQFLALPRYGPRDLIAEWWSDLRFYSSPARARLSHRRAARLLGAYAGRRLTSRAAPPRAPTSARGS